MVLGGGVPWVGPQEELRGPSGYTPNQGFYFEPKVGVEVRIFEVYSNKQTNKQTKRCGNWRRDKTGIFDAFSKLPQYRSQCGVESWILHSMRRGCVAGIETLGKSTNLYKDRDCFFYRVWLLRIKQKLGSKLTSEEWVSKARHLPTPFLSPFDRCSNWVHRRPFPHMNHSSPIEYILCEKEDN